MLTDIERERMVDQQVRAWDVLDEHTLEVLAEVPREHFVPAAWRELSYADCEIALPHGKRMLRPMLVGRILQSLAITGREETLEIGTGSGYMSACLARLGGPVRTLELYADIAAQARANLATSSLASPVEVVHADGMHLDQEAAFDAIVVTASLPVYETRFERALRPGGRLFVVVGSAPLMQAKLIRRHSVDEWTREVLFETCIEALDSAPHPPTFAF